MPGLQSVKVLKTKERLRNCLRWKRTKETGQLEEIRDSGLNPFSKKDIIGTTDEI